MPDFQSFDGTRLRYETDGDGPVVLLLHGFASDSYINWVRPGIVGELTGAGFRTVALDQRGHGGSDKPHEPSAYAGDTLARDVRALLDRLEVEGAYAVGYSMGAWVTAELAIAEARLRGAVLGGIGEAMLAPDTDRRERVARALEAADPREVDDPVGRSFRDFADLTGADRLALAALQRADRDRPVDLGSIGVPVLVVCGDNDPMAGSPEGLAARIPGARSAVVGGSHLNVINNPAFHREVTGFLRALEDEGNG